MIKKKDGLEKIEFIPAQNKHIDKKNKDYKDIHFRARVISIINIVKFSKYIKNIITVLL